MKSKIWALDTELTLEKVKELQNLNYDEPIEYLMDRNDLSYSDKTLCQKWEIVQDISTYSIKVGESIQNFRYYVSNAYWENAVTEYNAIIDADSNELLPRDRRVWKCDAGVIFVDISSRVYAIVYGNTSSFQVKAALMGGGRKYRRRPEWKRIEVAPVNYLLENDFFYWIFNKKTRDGLINTLYGDIEVCDIEGIGRLSARNQHNTRGTGPNSIDELSNKSALGINQLIYESDFQFSTQSLDLVVSLNERSECDINVYRSISRDLNTGQVYSINSVETLLKLYLEIIPGLSSSYNREKQTGAWAPVQVALAQRAWALEVIEELTTFHRITSEEITNLSAFRLIAATKNN